MHRCLRRPDVIFRPHDLTGSLQQSVNWCRCQILNLYLLQEQHILLITKPSLYSTTDIFNVPIVYPFWECYMIVLIVYYCCRRIIWYYAFKYFLPFNDLSCVKTHQFIVNCHHLCTHILKCIFLVPSIKYYE